MSRETWKPSWANGSINPTVIGPTVILKPLDAIRTFQLRLVKLYVHFQSILRYLTTLLLSFIFLVKIYTVHEYNNYLVKHLIV